MDFWDVAKLMWRRWYVTVPMLLATVVAAGWIGTSVQPDYQVTGHIAMIGSTVPQPEEEADQGVVNPWSTEALAEAAAIRLSGKSLADQLRAEGYQGEWSLSVTGRQPWLELQVVAPSPEQAMATEDQLTEIIAEEVQTRQEDYGIPSGEQITTLSYDAGETIETVTGKLRRALVVVVGIGLIVTMGTVIAYDAIARRVQRSRSGPAAGPPPAGPARRYPLAGMPDQPTSGHGTNGKAPARALGVFPVRVQFAEEGSHPLPPGGPPEGGAPHGGGDEPWTDPPDDEPARPGRRPPDDSTIVLPLSNLPWTHAPDPGPERSTEAQTP